MNKNVSFYLGILLFLFTASAIFYASDFENINNYFKILYIIIVLLLYVTIEYFKEKQLRNKLKAKIIRVLLSKVNDLLRYIPSQNLRSNIFCIKVEGGKKGYKIIYQFNMDHDTDRELFIWENLGVCGRIFNGEEPKVVTFATMLPEYRVQKNSSHLVRTDIKWIYGVPLTIRTGKEIMMVLTIDGNKEHLPEYEENIKKVVDYIKNDLQDIIPEFKDK